MSAIARKHLRARMPALQLANMIESGADL
jgi:hypothetical protein